jgi:hypothetical protein
MPQKKWLPWKPLYDFRNNGAAAAGTNFLFLPRILPGREMKVKYASCGTSVGGAKPISMGVTIQSLYYPFWGDDAPGNNEMLGFIMDLHLTEGMLFTARFELCVGAEVLDMFAHGFERVIKR